LDTYYIYRLELACQFKGGAFTQITIGLSALISEWHQHTKCYPSSSSKEENSNYTVHHSLWNFTVRQPTLMELL